MYYFKNAIFQITCAVSLTKLASRVRHDATARRCHFAHLHYNASGCSATNFDVKEALWFRHPAQTTNNRCKFKENGCCWHNLYPQTTPNLSTLNHAGTRERLDGKARDTHGRHRYRSTATLQSAMRIDTGGRLNKKITTVILNFQYFYKYNSL